MRFKVISVGRSQADPMAPLVADYLSRIKKILTIEDIVLRPEKQVRLVTRILKEVASSDWVLAMDETGRQYDSADFAAEVSSWMNRGLREVTFVIGGADGLPAEVKKRASQLVALSRMTLPHRMARLVLAEQLYRALATIRGVPYQK